MPRLRPRYRRLLSPVALFDDGGVILLRHPWKPKGYTDGYAQLSDAVLAALWIASDHGRLPVVCDATSFAEGLVTMQILAADSAEFSRRRFVDAVEFRPDEILGRLEVTKPVASIAVRPT